jgi:ribosomal silencing factor RsfS
VPWYLEVEPPKHPTLVVEAPPLPDVPEGSPKVMEPLVKFTSEALGLDDINIMDLRKLDPPPALGPNLLMIFGTARSERHLHVCADRLVRWFRKQGITASADGLLGRNELRTKEKRLARKMKRMGSGYSRSEDDDDGISTQWVCVNAGTVGGPETHVESVITSNDGSVVGFGVPQTGSTIVVQMFLAARREELNLEGYWKNKIMTPEERRAKKEAERLTDPFSAIQPAGAKQIPGGARYFSTSARRRQEDFPSPEAARSLDLAQVLARDLDSPGVLERVQDILQWDKDQKVKLLQKLQEFAPRLGPNSDDAVNTASRFQDVDERASMTSSFVRLYNIAVQNLDPWAKADYQRWLVARGRKYGWLDFDLQMVADVVQQMRLQPDNHDTAMHDYTQYVGLLEAIYARPSIVEGDIGREQSELAMKVLDTMHERDMDVLSNEVIVGLLDALVRSGARGPEADRIKGHLDRIIQDPEFDQKRPYMGEALLLKLLNAYASTSDWAKFWQAWRIPPHYNQPRSETLYFYMWQRIAQTQDKAMCMRAIRSHFHEMLNEWPPVAAEGRIREAIMGCVRYADPDAMSIAMDPSRDAMVLKNEHGREFVRILADMGVGPGFKASFAVANPMKIKKDPAARQQASGEQGHGASS